MHVTYDTRPPPGGKRSKLIDRIGDDFESGLGPVRTRGSGRGGGDRGGRGRGRGQSGGERGRRGNARDTPSTKSLADLDKELEAFMGEGTKENQTPASNNVSIGVATATTSTEDVAMA